MLCGFYIASTIVHAIVIGGPVPIFSILAWGAPLSIPHLYFSRKLHHEDFDDEDDLNLSRELQTINEETYVECRAQVGGGNALSTAGLSLGPLPRPTPVAYKNAGPGWDVWLCREMFYIQKGYKTGKKRNM